MPSKPSLHPVPAVDQLRRNGRNCMPVEPRVQMLAAADTDRQLAPLVTSAACESDTAPCPAHPRADSRVVRRADRLRCDQIAMPPACLAATSMLLSRPHLLIGLVGRQERCDMPRPPRDLLAHRRLLGEPRGIPLPRHEQRLLQALGLFIQRRLVALRARRATCHRMSLRSGPTSMADTATSARSVLPVRTHSLTSAFCRASDG